MLPSMTVGKHGREVVATAAAPMTKSIACDESPPRKLKHPLTSKESSAILAIEGNQRCFDCGTGRADWASVNLGITLCLRCAGRHRGYGVHVSFVRSMGLDDWADAEICSMMAGGNRALAEFLAANGCPRGAMHINSTSMEQREQRDQLYREPIAGLYRQQLKALSEGEGTGGRPNAEKDSREPQHRAVTTAKGRNDLPDAEDEAESETVAFKPTWAKNSRSCMLCKHRFSRLLPRRHHCRRCGRCVCAKCAPAANTRPILEWQILKPVRHCKECYMSPLLNWRER